MNQGRFARVIDGRYRVVRLLGEGGFGTVYLVEDQLKENEHLALKLLSREGMTEEEIGRLKNEFHAMAMLRHPGIARARDFGTEAESGRHYLTREYIPGVSLLEAARLLPADSLPNLFVQICGTLHYMHSRGVHHQDLKPQNILVEHCPPRNVRTSPRTKLLDFGLGWKEKSPATLTGTVHYAPPEAFMGGPLDGRSDLYSLGVIFYQVMTGRLPFDDGKPIAVINAHLYRQPEPPRSVQPNISRSMESIILRLLEKEPARRFSTALDLKEAIQQASSQPEAVAPVSPPETQLSSPAFIGRGPSLEAILAALGALKEGGTARPTAILVRGPAGIGKSRLIQEFRHQAQLEEIPFYTGTCHRSGGAPCGPFLEILRAVTARRGGLIERGQPPAGERQNRLLSLLGGTPLSTLPEEDQIRIPGTIQEFLVEAAKREPLILHLVDLQWSDQLSVEILRRIAARKNATPLLLIADLREEDAPEPVRDALAVLSRNPGVLLLDLAPLGHEEILRLIRSMLGTSQDFVKLAGLVHRCTGGNPLFAAELMKNLFEEGSLKMVSGRWRFDLDRIGTRVPGSVGEMISRRLEGLEPEEVDLLMVIAAFDRAVPAAWVGEIEGKPEPEIRERLENLSGNGLLETEPARPSTAAAEPRYRIRHRPFRDVLYHRLGDRAHPIHRRIGALLEGKETDSKESGAEELAWHFAQGGDRERGLRYCLEAADRAEAMQANDRAIMHLESALRLLGRGKKDQRAGILYRSGQVQQRIGDHAASIRNGRKAQEIWSDLGDRQGQITALDLIAWAYGSTGKYEQALKFAHRGLEIAEREMHPAGIAKCLNTIGMILSRSGSGEEALDYYRRALALWKEVGDKKRISSTLNNMGLVCLFQGRPEESLGNLQKSLALRKKTGDRRLAGQSLNNIGLCFKAMGRHDEALHSFEECIHLAHEVESRTDQASALFNKGETEVFLGQYDGALETYERAITLMEEIHNRHHIPTCLDGMGKAYERLGETASAAAARGRALEEARHLGDEVQEGFALASLAFDRFRLGEETDALRLLKEAEELAEKLSNRRIRMRALESRQRIALARGNRRRLQETADRIAKIAGESDLREDRLLALRARADALMAARAWGDAEGILAEAEGLARELGRAESHWEILSRLARCAFERKDLSRAADRNREAAGEIKRIASRIQEDAMREGYLRTPEKKQVLDRAETDGAAGAGEASPSPLSSRALMTLHDISRAITSILSLDELLERVMDLAIDLVGAERGILFVHDEASGEMRIRVARNAEKETLADASKYSSKVLRKSREGRSILALDAGSDDRFRNFQSVSLYHIQSLMCVPLLYQERVLGTVYLDTRRGRKAFSEEDLRFLEVFAGQAAVAMENASLYSRLEEENRYLKRCVEERYRYGNIIGKSHAMRTVYDLLDRLSESSLPVLVQGESGTGKELVARAIHFQSPRKKKKFVSENCAALPENLLESELFGHVKGAFTGADHPKDGLFLVADGGTLFLDEIADMSLAMQSKLLRAIQEGEIRPVGSTTTRKVDVRVVSATNQPPEKLIEAGKLRQDLYYRLSVLTINLPPLRDRKEDIPLLSRHFLDRIAESNQKPPYQIGQGVMDLLLRHSWPGNVRELENTLSRLALFTDTRITLRTVELDRQSYEKLTGLEEAPSGLATLDEVERLHILRVLEEADGDRARAARMLGISRATIFRKLKQYKLD